MNVETVKIDSLTFDPANVRKHDEKNLAAIKASLNRFGQQKPIVVDANGVVRAGNGTLAAAKALGWKEIRIVRSSLAGSEATAYAIADNRSAELAEWDEDALAQTLAALQIEDDALAEATGFDLSEIEKLTAPKEVEEDEVPEPPVDPITKPGDLWILGEHRLLCGDSTKADDVARLMAGEKADLLLSDPPYGVDYEGITNDDAAGLPSLLQGAMVQADANMCPGACYYICHPDVHAYEFIQAIRDRGWKQARPSVIVWVKDRFVLGRGDYHSQSEPILYGWKEGAAHHQVADRTQSNVWEFDRPAAAEGHPTMKPVGLFAKATQNSTENGDLVYDPFLGSGTTLIAAEQLGRKCFGIEISPQYCDVIVKRWENLTGKKAKRG